MVGRHDVELITRLRGTIQTQDDRRFAGQYLLDALITFVEHCLDAPMRCTCQHDVTHAERTIADQHRCHITASFVQRRLDDRALGAALGVRLQVQHLGFKEHFVEQLAHAVTFLRRDVLALIFTAPILNKDIHVRQFLLDFVGVGTGFVALVDSKHHGHACSLRVTDCLACLWHDAIVGGDNDDSDIRHLCTAGTHGGESLVTRRVEERYMLSGLKRYVVCTNMLGNTARLTGNDVGVADMVEQRGLTMIHVPHNRYDWCAGHYILIRIFALVLTNLRHHLGADILGLEPELFSNDIDSLGIQTLVDANHHSQRHTGSNNFGNRHIHHYRQVVSRNKLGQFQYFRLSSFLL